MDMWLKRISRISSWLLLACVVVLVVSGWGITQTGAVFNATGGLIDRRTADMIHRGVVLPMAVFFLSHVFINIWLKFKNRRPWVKYLAAALILALGLLILWLVIYMEYLRLGG
jgi:cytochrome b subunit of formate dehydrogenase